MTGTAFSTTVLAAAALALPVVSGQSIRRGLNDDPNPGPEQPPPYEMAGRDAPRPALATFEDCTAWEVVGTNAEAALFRSRERQLFSPVCGKLVYRATGPRPSVTVRPRERITIPDPWDCVNAWNWGNAWGWARDPGTPFLRVDLLLEDAEGREHSVDLGVMNCKYWFPMHRKVAPTIPRPVRFAGFRFHNGTNTENRTIYLGPVSFYAEDLPPLTFAPWPDTLPFPTRPETIQPTNRTDRYRNALIHTADETVFTYTGSDGVWSYRYSPRSGTLSDIRLDHGDRSVQPCRGGGVRPADNTAADHALWGEPRILSREPSLQIRDLSRTQP